ncbi:hypothetical protein AVEN_43277-1 [Araneus ventricosus]|uniref:Uncharacterized protein n=1 Tax=Araneus ventricosus TaxID=182803 RepID=A0A4Y2GGI1_ARAVE|nr:hypothetical protein AVEN_43277-1 [Araneus ventricosus]
MRETIASERYITILEQFVSTRLALEDRSRIEWFMQDGADHIVQKRGAPLVQLRTMTVATGRRAFLNERCFATPFVGGIEERSS